jgi:hypothetical protein
LSLVVWEDGGRDRGLKGDIWILLLRMLEMRVHLQVRRKWDWKGAANLSTVMACLLDDEESEIRLHKGTEIQKLSPVH